MISKEDYALVSANWTGKIYQKYKNIKERLKILDRHLSVFDGKDVLEIGCNAGMAAVSIAPIAKSYQGIEPGDEYKEQFNFTKEKILCVVDRDVRFHHGNLKSTIDVVGPFNALFASYVIYHFNDEEVEIFKTKVLPKCDVAIILNRSAERHVDKNSHKLNRGKNVVRIMREAGFSVELEWGEAKKMYGVICVRP